MPFSCLIISNMFNIMHPIYRNLVLAIEYCTDCLKDKYHHQQYFRDHRHRHRHRHRHCHRDDPDRDCRLKEPIMGYVWLLAVGEGQVCCERQGPSSLIDYPATNGPPSSSS